MIKLTRQLFPTGRAFKIAKDSNIEKLLYALTLSETRFHLELIGILDLLLPDNANFDEDEAALWEARLGLTVNPPFFSLENRILLIKSKYNHPGTIIPRQNYRYLEKVLRDAGFDVYVHEQIVDPATWLFQHATDTEHGTDTEMGFNSLNLIANSVTDNEIFNIGYGYTGIVFIGGQTFPDHAIIGEEKIQEFRRLVLKVKPVNTIVALIIDFSSDFKLMDGDDFILMDGEKLKTVQ